MSIEINLTKFNKVYDAAVAKTFKKCGEVVRNQLTLQDRPYVMAEDEYGNPTPTRRKKGILGTKLAFDPRDVVDTGDLMNSQINTSEKILSIDQLSIEYTDEEAPYIYTGYQTQDGREQPPYPWIEIGLSKLNIPETFKDSWHE